MKILLAEPDRSSALPLQKALRACGYLADLAEDGETALHLARHRDFDLIVLEVLLPARDGWSVLRQLREAGNQTPVLFVTASAELADRVKGLDLGADDYLAKPFAFSELLARLRAVSRRAPRKEPEFLRIGELEIDLLRRKVSRAGRRVELTRKEFALLALLARRAGEVVSHAELTEQVWDMNYQVEANTIAVHVRRLRSKIDNPFEYKLVGTVRGVGYVMREHVA